MHLYDYVGYCQMIHDEKRLKAFTEALKRVITPETMVLEIGAGTGVFTYLACKYGAKKIFALEPNPIIQIAKEAIIANGFESKVDFIEDISTNFVLDKKVDLLLCDLHGSLPYFENGINTIIDARNRLLKKDAAIIPYRETVYLAAVECPVAYQNMVADNLEFVGEYTIPSANVLLTNKILNLFNNEQKLVSDSQIFDKFDYKTVATPNAHNKVHLNITEKATVHGIRAWFVSELIEGVFVDNSIDSPKATYGQPMFPFPEPVDVDINDFIEFELNFTLEHQNYNYSWISKIFEKNGSLKKHFQQTSLLNNLKSTKSLVKRSEYFVPDFNPEGLLNKFILDMFDGVRMNGDIADLVLEHFPDKFVNFDEALNHVIETTLHFSR